MNEQSNSGPQNNMPAIGRWFLIALDGPPTTLRVFLHYRFGSKQPGLAGVMGLLILILFAAQSSPRESGPVAAFAGLFLVMCLLRRIGASRRYFQRNEEHSWHDGYTYVHRFLPVISEAAARQFVEPLIAVAAGIVISPLSPPLCIYLCLAGFCLFLTQAAREGIHRRQIRRMQDRVIEQTNIAQSFRRMTGLR